MTVNSDVEVANLHAAKATGADTLDGKDCDELAPKAVEAWHEAGAANGPPFRGPRRNVGSTISTAAFYEDP
jgi:hypothetical protein